MSNCDCAACVARRSGPAEAPETLTTLAGKLYEAHRHAVGKLWDSTPWSEVVDRYSTTRDEWLAVAAAALATPGAETLSARYQELIYAVGNKYPDESRHETALRYIRRAEAGSNEASAARSPTQEPPKPACNCGQHRPFATTAGWTCPVHGHQS